jgi:hypothetical protein
MNLPLGHERDDRGIQQPQPQPAVEQVRIQTTYQPFDLRPYKIQKQIPGPAEWEPFLGPPHTQTTESPSRAKDSGAQPASVAGVIERFQLQRRRTPGSSSGLPGGNAEALGGDSSGVSVHSNPATQSIDEDAQHGSYGTLMLDKEGRSKYLGPTAGSEWLKEV